MDEVGAGGGFILAPSHNIQPDTPLENVLTVYRAVSRRRGPTTSDIGGRCKEGVVLSRADVGMIR